LPFFAKTTDITLGRSNNSPPKGMYFSRAKPLLLKLVFLLARAGVDAGRALTLIERGIVQIGLSLNEQSASVRHLYERYGNVPSSLADACLIRLSELHEPCQILTIDIDFHTYRRHGRKAIPVISP
jgi:uncharacterized protein